MNKLNAEMILRMLMLGHMAGQMSAGIEEKKVSMPKAKEYANDTLQKIIEAAEEETKANCNAGEAVLECYSCIYKQEVPGNAHIACNNPDPKMIGDSHGIQNGWFMYPILFDPTWKRRKCANVKKK